MELLDNLAIGFGTALTLQNLFYAFAGCLIGTLIGVLPFLVTFSLASTPGVLHLSPAAAGWPRRAGFPLSATGANKGSEEDRRACAVGLLHTSCPLFSLV